MVPQLRNVLRFLKFSGISIPDFEAKMNLSPGSMRTFLEEKKELTPEMMSKVATFYRHEIQSQGYYTIGLAPFGGKGIGLVYGLRDEDNPFEENTDDHTNWLIDHRRKQGEVERETWLKIEVKGIELPIAVINFDYHTLLDMLSEEEYSHENTSSTDLIVFRVRNNFKEGKSTTIFIDPEDGHNEHVFWTVG
jgi:hypothetical protein